MTIFDSAGCATHVFLHGPGIDQPLAFMQDTNANCSPFGDAVGFREPIRYLQTDGLGSITSLVQEVGGFFRTNVPAERVTYDTFGTPQVTSAGPDQQLDTADDLTLTASDFGSPYLFTGREWDAEMGLYYYRARYYDPRTGTFVQEDPVGLSAGINLYRYSHDNPNRYTDPFGLDQKEVVVVTSDGIPHSVLQVDDPSSPTGERYFDFFPAQPFSRIKVGLGFNIMGEVRETTVLDPTARVVGIRSEKDTSEAEDQQTIDEARGIKEGPPRYNLYRENCFSFTEDLLN